MSSQPLLKSDAFAELPVHVAIIMDGNRRWARGRGMPPAFGHRHGADAVKRTVEEAGRLGVRYLTLYAFSSENWARPHSEIRELMNLLRYYLDRELDVLDRNGVRVRVIGDRSPLDADIKRRIAEAETHTTHNVRLDLIVALNYGSRAEITRAVQHIARSVRDGNLDPDEISERHIDQALYTGGIPDPDLLIRTSGEQRISNFLLWQLAYTELIFVPVAWPDFGEVHLREAVDEYARRERRYGARAG